MAARWGSAIEGELEQATEPVAGTRVEVPLVRRRALQWWIRIVLTATTVLACVLVALIDERPGVMLVGLAPLALVAAEAVWHLFDSDRVV